MVSLLASLVFITSVVLEVMGSKFPTAVVNGFRGGLNLAGFLEYRDEKEVN